jgi:Terminase RNaseH-like domain/Phage terminase large subunit
MKPFRLTEKQDIANRLLGQPQRNSCLVGGARSGKTFVITRKIVMRGLKAAGSRHAILRLRFNAVRASIGLDTFPKVMSLCYPNIRWKEHRQDGFFRLQNGSEIWIGGLDEKERVEKILGQEYASMFFNECSQIPWASVVLALTRLAQNVPLDNGKGMLPVRSYFDLNPTGLGHWTNKLFGEKRMPGTQSALVDPEHYARMFMSPHDNIDNLPEGFINSLGALPERQRKRFLEGVYTPDSDGVLWTFDNIEANRNTGKIVKIGEGPDARYELPVADRKRVVVAVDASGAKDADDTGSDEIGIVVCATGTDGHGYVLADRSLRASPAEWGKVVVNAYREFNADHVTAEGNFGGEMVRFVIRTADPNVPVRMVTASRGKEVRAEPVSVLYENKKVHHVGRFDKLEDQMCSFTTAGYIGEGSPDHADALVWALTDLMVADNHTGLLDHYIAEAAKLEGTATTHPIVVPNTAPAVIDGVRLKARAGVSNAYGIRGNSYCADAEGFFIVHVDDVNPLIAQGFTLA